MAFLAGPPDRGPGSVLRRKRPPAPLVPPPMTDISYTSLALGLQPSPQEDMSRDSDSDRNQPLLVQICHHFSTKCMQLQCSARQGLLANSKAATCLCH